MSKVFGEWEANDEFVEEEEIELWLCSKEWWGAVAGMVEPKNGCCCPCCWMKFKFMSWVWEFNNWSISRAFKFSVVPSDFSSVTSSSCLGNNKLENLF